MSDTTITPENTEEAPNERRALLRKLAIGGAGAAAGVAMLKSGTASALPEPGALNWGPGDIQIANSISVAVDATRQIKVFCGNQTGSTDVIIDVYGYYI